MSPTLPLLPLPIAFPVEVAVVVVAIVVGHRVVERVWTWRCERQVRRGRER